MSRACRKVKTLFNNPNQRNHRDHRSKKNRKKLSKDRRWILNQTKKREYERIEKEMENEIKKSL